VRSVTGRRPPKISKLEYLCECATNVCMALSTVFGILHVLSGDNPSAIWTVFAVITRVMFVYLGWAQIQNRWPRAGFAGPFAIILVGIALESALLVNTHLNSTGPNPRDWAWSIVRGVARMGLICVDEFQDDVVAVALLLTDVVDVAYAIAHDTPCVQPTAQSVMPRPASTGSAVDVEHKKHD